jgi:hypothetical protein
VAVVVVSQAVSEGGGFVDLNGVRSAVAFLFLLRRGPPASPRPVPSRLPFFAWVPALPLPAFRFRGGARYGPHGWLVRTYWAPASATRTAHPPGRLLSRCFLLASWRLLPYLLALLRHPSWQSGRQRFFFCFLFCFLS